MITPPLFRRAEFEPFLAHYGAISVYASKLMQGRREDAEDLTQCVFAQAWRSNFDMFHPNKLAWLKKIAYYEWVDALRRTFGRKKN